MACLCLMYSEWLCQYSEACMLCFLQTTLHICLQPSKWAVIMWDIFEWAKLYVKSLIWLIVVVFFFFFF